MDKWTNEKMKLGETLQSYHFKVHIYTQILGRAAKSRSCLIGSPSLEPSPPTTLRSYQQRHLDTDKCPVLRECPVSMLMLGTGLPAPYCGRGAADPHIRSSALGSLTFILHPKQLSSCLQCQSNSWAGVGPVDPDNLARSRCFLLNVPKKQWSQGQISDCGVWVLPCKKKAENHHFWPFWGFWP